MNYSELKSNIADFLNRSDLTAVIPTFIQLAEGRLNRQLRTVDQYTRATLSSTDQFLSMPDDFLEMTHLRTTSPIERELHEIAAHQINEVNDPVFIASLDDANPQYYTYHQVLRVYPAPEAGTTIDYEMFYYAKLASLSDSNTTNWLSTAYPDAYLYYSLMQSAPYLGEDERMQVWGSLADRAVQEIQGADNRRKSYGSRKRLNFEAFS